MTHHLKKRFRVSVVTPRKKVHLRDVLGYKQGNSIYQFSSSCCQTAANRRCMCNRLRSLPPTQVYNCSPSGVITTNRCSALVRIEGNITFVVGVGELKKRTARTFPVLSAQFTYGEKPYTWGGQPSLSEHVTVSCRTASPSVKTGNEPFSPLLVLDTSQ